MIEFLSETNTTYMDNPQSALYSLIYILHHWGQEVLIPWPKLIQRVFWRQSNIIKPNLHIKNCVRTNSKNLFFNNI